MVRLDHRVRRSGQEAVDEMRTGDRLGLRASVALELGMLARTVYAFLIVFSITRE
jgi:hypothetical protein